MSGAPKQDFRFIARQPILNREQQVFGYELLFRDGIENFFHAADLEAAARHTLDSTLLMGFDVLCDGQRAFINCTRELLLKDGITLLPSSQTVVEVLASVDRDDLVMAACERMKIAGTRSRSMTTWPTIAASPWCRSRILSKWLSREPRPENVPSWLSDMAAYAAACWSKESKRRSNFRLPRTRASFTSKATFFAVRKS